MSQKEIHRVEVIQKLIDKRLIETEAAVQLGLSIRQIRRLKQAYIQKGVFGLTSKKRGARSNHKYPDALKEVATLIVREHYADFKPTFACEKLRENHQITVSNETCRKWMIEAALWQPRSQRLKRAYQPRHRRACYGELIQIDGSLHDWFEDRGDRCTLLVYIDDATGQLMECQFVPCESTFTLYRVNQLSPILLQLNATSKHTVSPWHFTVTATVRLQRIKSANWAVMALLNLDEHYRV